MRGTVSGDRENKGNRGRLVGGPFHTPPFERQNTYLSSNTGVGSEGKRSLYGVRVRIMSTIGATHRAVNQKDRRGGQHSVTMPLVEKGGKLEAESRRRLSVLFGKSLPGAFSH